MEYARVENGMILERQDIDNVPAHKAYLWRPIVHEGSGPIVNSVVESDRVRLIRSDFPLPDIKADLKQRVDDDAEAIRLRHITSGTGMAMTYAEKQRQAIAVHAMGQLAADAMSGPEMVEQFPTLAASVGLEGPTLWDCAQLVISKAEAWSDLSFAVERTRLAGKKAIGDASDAASARAAYEAITWLAP